MQVYWDFCSSQTCCSEDEASVPLNRRELHCERSANNLDRWLSGDSEPPVIRLVGIKLISYQEGRAQLELSAGPQHHNPMGIIHGGILCDLADAAMGVAMATLLKEDETFSTVALDIHYFRPVTEALLTAVAQVTQRSARIGYVESEIRDEDERLIAKATSTRMIQ
ncbi:MAG: PaaI family thioesterase [Anaerolineales bacterium]